MSSERETVYSHVDENLRVVDTGLSKYNIILDRQEGLWHIEVDTGSVPVQLRNKWTSHKNALTDIKNYLDQHRERQIVYKKLPSKSE